jgi:SSS family solute:Na+ symporter
MVINIIDWIILGSYFIGLFAIGLYFSKKEKSTSQYFLANRNSKWYQIGLSIFAANISSEHLIGLAGSGAAVGLAVGAYEWVAVFCLFLLAWLFIPHYLRSKVFTMPEFLEKRYSSGSRWYLSSISILAYIFTKISVSLFAGAILLKVIVGWDFLTSAIILVAVTGLYTMLGGLSAVIFADVIQSIILIIGSAIIVLIGLDKVGGFEGLRASLPADFFSMIRPANHGSYPWTGTTIGIFILGIWYWSTDQFIVQKALSAKNINHAQTGINLTAFLKILPVFLFVLPGLIAKSLWPAELADSPDNAFPFMITRLMPNGMAGIMIAALLAALVSSLSSVFNASSTLITMDIYKKIRPESSEKQLVLAGRLFTLVIVIIGLLWIPMIRHMSNQVYQYLQAVQAYISPPIAAVFILGVFWKKASAKAALITLISGGILGASRFIIDMLYKQNGGFDFEFLNVVANIAFLNFCIILFAICMFIMFVVSLISKEKITAEQEKLTIGYKENKVTEGNRIWRIVNIITSVLIALTIIGFWIHFA